MSSNGVRVSVLVTIDTQDAPLARPVFEIGDVVNGVERPCARAAIGCGDVFVEGACLKDVAGWFAASAEAIIKRAKEIERMEKQ